LIEQNGRPKWRSTATITWRHGDFGAGYYMSYMSGVNDTSAALADGTLWRVDSFQTHNLYLQYTFDTPDFAINDLRVRVGARNLTDEAPPLADSEYGFVGDLHSARGRTWYLSLNKRF
jgi:outer membrane receptor protein involved in Fe transport